MLENEQNIQRIMNQLAALSQEQQSVILWLIDQINLVEAIAIGENLSESDIEEFTTEAYKRNDYRMMAMILYQQNIATKEMAEQ